VSKPEVHITTKPIAYITGLEGAEHASLSFLELDQAQPGDVVLSDEQMIAALRALIRYVRADSCSCVEGSIEKCRCCQGRFALRLEVTREFF
jgi:hypothetical protein